MRVPPQPIIQFHPPDGVAVTQMQAYYAENGRGYTTTATTPSTQFDRFEWAFNMVLSDIAI